jgi:hypothetical protein
VQVVRRLLRVGILVLTGLAVFCGLGLLFHAQVALNRYAELHASESETPLTAGSTGDESAKSQSSFIDSPALASAANDALHPGAPPASNGQTTSPESQAKDERAFPVRVSSAKIVAGATAADRRVDVVLAHQAESGSTFSEVVLENVRVLTIEPIVAGNGNNERSDIYAVRLDVDAESTDNLLLASQAGTLSLVLHGAKDNPDDRPSEPRRNGIPALAQEEPKPAHDEATPAQDDDPRFTHVRINRVGGPTSTYRVPRER